jgi:endogenous inhibitor of DNA gyrase (YacG/DUF329 family)
VTDAEREELRRHEEWISQPVHVLFPPTSLRITSVCRHCKETYTRSAHAGKSRGFCTERCRDAWCNARKGRVSKSPPRIPQSNRRSA